MKNIRLIGILKQYPEDMDIEVEYHADGDDHITLANGVREEVGIEGQVTRVVILT